MQLIEQDEPSLVGIRGTWRGNAEQQDSLRLEAEVHGHEIRQRADEQACADEEQDRQAHLKNDKRLSARPSWQPERRPASVLQGRIDLDARRLPRWREAEEDSGGERDPDGNTEDAAIEFCLEGA